MKNYSWIYSILVGACALGSGACNTDLNKVGSAVDGDAGLSVQGLAKQCGLECPTEGIAKGNAAISGVASVDAFFGAVVNYQTTADGVSSELEDQLDAIKPDFGLAADADLSAELDAQAKLYLDAGLTVENEPAHCSVDVKTVLKAAASCDSSVNAKTPMLACAGTCEGMTSASAKCEGGAMLECTTTAASVTCAGDCRGACDVQLKAAGSCAGTCEGTCSGTCSAYTKDSAGKDVCRGECSGMCTGTCRSELAVGAKCAGECDGECVVNDSTSQCMASAKVSCHAKASSMVMCAGRCNGDCEPPKAKVECEATAKVQAKLHVQCTPPRVVVRFKLAAVSSDKLAAQARFVAGVRSLEARLPALLAAIERAKSVGGASDMLVSSADGAVKASFKAAASGKLSLKQTVGLGCAVNELGDVADAISASTDHLNATLKTCAKLQTTLGIKI